MIQNRKLAFTLAEVLITLGIIGVVAAITLPTLIQNYKKQAYVTQLKKTVSNLENAFKLAMAEDGVDDLGDTQLWQSIPGTSLMPADFKDSEFIERLGKYIKIIDVKDASYRSNIKYLNYTGTMSVEGAIFLADGSRLLAPFFIRGNNTRAPIDQIKNNGGHLYNFYSMPVTGYFNSIDVNGEKGPNQVGRDIFSFAIGQDGKLYPACGKDIVINWYSAENYKSDSAYWNQNGSMKRCSMTTESTGEGCMARIIEEGWQMNY